jgi:hypothetical protein
MILHDLFGRHSADLEASHWSQGNLISRCTTCGREMKKLPGLSWQLSKGSR